MRWLTSALIVFVALATSNLRWPCECEAMQPAPAATAAAAPAGHGCCAGGHAAAATADRPLTDVRFQRTCAPGCCDGEDVALTALVDGRQDALGLEAPVAHLAPALAPADLPLPSLAFVPGARDIRGPPPPLIPRRLAQLQLWRC